MANPEDTLILETTKGNVVVEMRPDLAANATPVHRPPAAGSRALVAPAPEARPR